MCLKKPVVRDRPDVGVGVGVDVDSQGAMRHPFLSIVFPQTDGLRRFNFAA
jgi:hypothetical protein